MPRKSEETKRDAEVVTEKQPPFAGTVAARVFVPSVPENEDPASPGADADRRQAAK